MSLYALEKWPFAYGYLIFTCQISPKDIRWEGENLGVSRKSGHPGPGQGVKKSVSRGGAVTRGGRGRGTLKGQTKKDFSSSQNGIGKKAKGDIEIVHTDTLIKEVGGYLIVIISFQYSDSTFP